MDKVELDYSTKNIPIHSRREYRTSLIQKSRIFLRNLRWKAHFYLNPRSKVNNSENYGFKSDKNAPQVLPMKDFESDFIKMIENVKL